MGINHGILLLKTFWIAVAMYENTIATCVKGNSPETMSLDGYCLEKLLLFVGWIPRLSFHPDSPKIPIL